MPVRAVFTRHLYNTPFNIVACFTLRKPETRCSHVSTKFKSTCHQVYNYHRLLTWDQFSGLTMDIFKVTAETFLGRRFWVIRFDRLYRNILL